MLGLFLFGLAFFFFFSISFKHKFEIVSKR